MQQYTLPLKKISNYHSDDFIFSSCNQLLLDVINNISVRWGHDPYPEIILLSAPERSGKTHFSYVLRDIAPDIIILDDIDIGKNEEELLHIFNSCHENHHKALFICKEYKNFKLPDLKSRLASVRLIGIDSPDDFMMKSLLIKSLIDRSIKVSEDVVKFLLARIPRSFPSIESSIEMIDRLSIEQKRNISVPFLSSLKL